MLAASRLLLTAFNLGCGSSKTANKYEVVKLLGEGVSCKVQMAKDAEGQLYAIKVIKSGAEFKSMFLVESHILRTLKHPNVVQLVEAYEDKTGYIIVTMLCRGGELFDRVVKQGSFSEKNAAAIVRDLMKALAYCHQNNVVHRDIKPENLLFDTDAPDSSLRLIDFGCAKLVQDDELVKDFAGSPYYVAPEVLKDVIRTGKMWKASDMWSVGVILYLLVTGYPPFNGRNQDEIFAEIRKGKFAFPRSSEIPLSEGVKNLIRQLLVMDPSKRLTAQKALEHPWIGGEAPDTPLPATVAKSLSAFSNQTRLKKAIGRALAQRMTDEDKKSLATVFKQFDKNGDGQLGADEIAAMMKHIGAGVDQKEFFAKLDEDGSGAISPDEFAAATMAGKLADQSAEEMKRNFDLFDENKDGFVTAKEIEKLCGGMDPVAAKALILEVDKNSDGKIDFMEWLEAMKGNQKQQPAPKATAGSAPSLPPHTGAGVIMVEAKRG